MPDVAGKLNPTITVIIPTRDGMRDGAVPKLLDSVKNQTFQDFEIQMIKGVTPQGKSINQGAAAAKGRYLLILDDDSCLADPHVFQRLLEACESDHLIGMAGASIVIAPDATLFQRRAAGQFPRFCTPEVDVITDSDFACHGCCLIPAAVFAQIGGERENLIRGLDPDLRVRLRAAGYRVVLVPGARIHHPLPDGWRPLLRIFFRNGFGSAYAWKFQPDTVYETHERLDMTSFHARRPFIYRVLRFPGRLLLAAAQGRPMRFAAYIAYGFGYIWGLATAKRTAVSGG